MIVLAVLLAVEVWVMCRVLRLPLRERLVALRLAFAMCVVGVGSVALAFTMGGANTLALVYGGGILFWMALGLIAALALSLRKSRQTMPGTPLR